MNHQTNSHDSISRRKFLALSGVVPAVLAAQALSPAVGMAADEPVPAAPGGPVAPAVKDKYPIGLELYSVRGELQRNLPETLRMVAQIGYPVVEFYAPYLDWKIPYAKTVRTLMDDLGLRCYSTHNSIGSFTPGDSMAHAIELNQILGSRLVVMAMAPGDTKGVEGWKKLCGQLSTAVELFNPHGLAAGYHNHNAEWVPLDGSLRIMDFLAANTPKEFVLQLDVGTCVNAGADPVAWIKANPGRIKVIHLKDWAPGDRADEKSYRVLFGEGVSPWKEICAAAESVGGVEYYLMEQEGSRFPEFETVHRCLDSWKKLRAGA
jgi:sugar phosphate isomerase/epimerase